ncbi:carbonic anhydrase-related protein 10 [Trichonephila inaurata madagascariensis]|uniref:Carbonic anhydrase-related protein 10 n=1 Tax=Trichonephila inaurata madagascariensis TaxID=2747483 RepID=A0A8X6YGN2_9ARAC|nr:carbonic anhydrase-related protein 10 [Trichonephila inaurata madagascariensis]
MSSYTGVDISTVTPRLSAFEERLIDVALLILVSGILTNTGHSVAFRVSDVQPGVPINISGGPLSYKYRFHELHLHYGRTDDRGSEHTVSGTSFPGEVRV